MFSLVTLLACNMMVAQTGTVTNPFTSLDQANSVTVDGIYHFNISGTNFSTYVEALSGWILIASGDQASSGSSYNRTTSLTLQSDEVLPAPAYNQVEIVAVRINATAGPNIPFDVESTNANVLNNLRLDRTLSIGTNSGAWTGTGTNRMLRSCISNVGTMATHIYHACGNTQGLHWQVGRNVGHEKIVFSGSEINALNLWVRAESVVLPVELSSFKAEVYGDGKVLVSWETSTEIDNDYFIIEQSDNGISWSEMGRVNGIENSQGPNSYELTDPNPLVGVSYYRLSQVDINGRTEYLGVRSLQVVKKSDNEWRLYPNPARSELYVEYSSDLSESNIEVFSAMGKKVDVNLSIIKLNQSTSAIDVSQLLPGLYYVRINATIQTFVKL